MATKEMIKEMEWKDGYDKVTEKTVGEGDLQRSL